uniref:Cyclin-like domain-containing protein n=1 Tax=Ananas comosus var. bracteatus TaxID=296719 RepID=A0A6V7PGU2_ANACO|nr:unnamed protein product [Ananas comosus var. bracteatus]
MGQSGRLNDLDKFHSVFQQVWKNKNEFQRCWNGFDIDRREVEPKQGKEISTASSLPQKEIGKYIKILGEALKLSQPINSNSMSVHIPRFCTLLQLNKSAQELAAHIGEVVINKWFCTRRNPISISAAAIYLACQLEDPGRDMQSDGAHGADIIDLYHLNSKQDKDKDKHPEIVKQSSTRDFLETDHIFKEKGEKTISSRDVNQEAFWQPTVPFVVPKPRLDREKDQMSDQGINLNETKPKLTESNQRVIFRHED